MLSAASRRLSRLSKALSAAGWLAGLWSLPATSPHSPPTLPYPTLPYPSLLPLVPNSELAHKASSKPRPITSLSYFATWSERAGRQAGNRGDWSTGRLVDLRWW
ncbi:hypothetical protein IWZ01DRAFT_29081 [Phyllosticta capitalensis]